nr:hypothetical protein [Tanacetum cinerariifolium]
MKKDGNKKDQSHHYEVLQDEEENADLHYGFRLFKVSVIRSWTKEGASDGNYLWSNMVNYGFLTNPNRYHCALVFQSQFSEDARFTMLLPVGTHLIIIVATAVVHGFISSWLSLLSLVMICRGSDFVYDLNMGYVGLDFLIGATIRTYKGEELRYCAQCLIIDEDFIKRSRFTLEEERVIFLIMLHDGYFEPLEGRISSVIYDFELL